MLRKIFLFLLVIAMLVVGMYFFNNQSLQSEDKHPLSSVPTDAAVIFKSVDFQNLWHQLSETNLMWQEIIQTPFFGRLEENALTIDSIISNSELLSSAIEKNPVYASLHRSGVSDYTLLYTLKLRGEEVEVINGLKAIVNLEIKEQLHGNTTIYSIVLENYQKPELYASFYKGILNLSFSRVIIEDALAQTDAAVNLLSDKSFKQVLSTSGDHVDANVFIQYEYFNKLVASHLEVEASEKFTVLRDFGKWAALDLLLKPNALMFNGFTSIADSQLSFLSCFRDQSPQQLDILDVLPENTSNLLVFGVSNFSKFHQSYTTFLEKKKDKKSYQSWLEEINTSLNIDLEQEMASIAGNEFALFMQDSKSESPSSQQLFMLRTSSHVQAMELFRRLSANPGTTNEETGELVFDGLLNEYFGFGEDQGKLYWMDLNPYVLFGYDKSSLMSCAASIKGGNNLSGNESFQLFRENLSSQSSVFLYSNFSRSKNFYQENLNKEWTSIVEEYGMMLKKFEAIGIQFSAGKRNLFYQNIFCNYNPMVKKENKSLWETALDTLISGRPYIVINHYTNAKEIFVQDARNQVYLLDNKGNILWKRKLEGPIISKVAQIDVYKNNKLQLLFNTADNLHLIDRKGRNVTNFPVKIKAGASTGLELIDYDKNRNYRVLIPTKDKKVLNFEGDGTVVKGWTMKPANATISRPIQYFALNGKDYIIAVTDEGEIIVMDRRGQDRIKIMERLNLSQNNGFYLEIHRDISLCKLVATDSTGKVTKISMDGKKEDVVIDEFSADHYFEFKDINNDKTYEYIFLDNQNLRAYSADKTLRFEVELENEIKRPIQYFSSIGKYGKFGIVDEEDSRIYLFLDAGGLDTDFPISGTGAFSIDDINADGMNDVVVGLGSSLIVYTLRR